MPYTKAMTPTVATRRRRFQRDPEQVALNVTDRHVRIIAFVARFRFASFTQIAVFDGGSEQKVHRICRALFDAGYLDRPLGQITNVWAQCYKPIVYALAERGAELLEERLALNPKHLDWQLKNERAGNVFIEHAVATTELVLAFLIAARERGYALQDHRDLLPAFPLDTRRAKNPFALSVQLDGETQRIVPDRLFSLVHEPSVSRYNYALEIDRGTMPIDRLSFASRENSRFAAKLPVYLTAHLAQLYKTWWNFDRLRILTIAPNEARISNMIAAANAIDLPEPEVAANIDKDRKGNTKVKAADTKQRSGKAPPGLFLFTTPERLATKSPLEAVWTNLNGELVELGVAAH